MSSKCGEIRNDSFVANFVEELPYRLLVYFSKRVQIVFHTTVNVGI